MPPAGRGALSVVALVPRRGEPKAPPATPGKPERRQESQETTAGTSRLNACHSRKHSQEAVG